MAFPTDRSSVVSDPRHVGKKIDHAGLHGRAPSAWRYKGCRGWLGVDSPISPGLWSYIILMLQPRFTRKRSRARAMFRSRYFEQIKLRPVAARPSPFVPSVGRRSSLLVGSRRHNTCTIELVGRPTSSRTYPYSSAKETGNERSMHVDGQATSLSHVSATSEPTTSEGEGSSRGRCGCALQKDACPGWVHEPGGDRSPRAAPATALVYRQLARILLSLP